MKLRPHSFSKKQQLSLLLVVLVLVAGIVIAIRITTLVPSMKSFSNDHFSISYPVDLKLKNSTFPDSPDNPDSGNVTAVSMTLDPKNPTSENILIVAEPTDKTTVSHNISDTVTSAAAVDKKLEKIKVGGKQGVKISWKEKMPETGTYNHNVWVQAIKNKTLYTLQITYDETHSTFEEQTPNIVQSFNIK